MSGGMSPIASVAGPMIAANRAGLGGPTPGYVSPSQLSQAPMYQPTQTASQVSPLVQQMMMQRQMSQFNPYQQQMMGLPAALMQMQGRLNQPMMRGSMPTYQNPALAYRPDMQNSQQALGRVVNIAEQRRLQAIENESQRLAAENERQRLAAEEASRYSG